jgi:hypothetical protein
MTPIVTEHTWFVIQHRHPKIANGDWIDTSQTPLINREGVLDTNEEIWKLFVKYLSLAQSGEYRLVKRTRTTTTTEVIDV